MDHRATCAHTRLTCFLINVCACVCVNEMYNRFPSFPCPICFWRSASWGMLKGQTVYVYFYTNTHTHTHTHIQTFPPQTQFTLYINTAYRNFRYPTEYVYVYIIYNIIQLLCCPELTFEYHLLIIIVSWLGLRGTLCPMPHYVPTFSGPPLQQHNWFFSASGKTIRSPNIPLQNVMCNWHVWDGCSSVGEHVGLITGVGISILSSSNICALDVCM